MTFSQDDQMMLPYARKLLLDTGWALRRFQGSGFEIPTGRKDCPATQKWVQGLVRVKTLTDRLWRRGEAGETPEKLVLPDRIELSTSPLPMEWAGLKE